MKRSRMHRNGKSRLAKTGLGRPFGFVLILVPILMTQPLLADIYKFEDAEGRILLTDNPGAGRGMSLLKRFRLSYAKPHSGGAAPALPKLKQKINRLSPHIHRVAERMGFDPDLIHAVILAESAYREKALSPKGAMGLMQLMPATAKRLGVEDPWDPVQNIEGGAKYLRFLLDRYQGDVELAVAAYNAGEGAVDKYGRTVPPYKETVLYVKKVKEFMNKGLVAFR